MLLLCRTRHIYSVSLKVARHFAGSVREGLVRNLLEVRYHIRDYPLSSPVTGLKFESGALDSSMFLLSGLNNWEAPCFGTRGFVGLGRCYCGGEKALSLSVAPTLEY